MEVCQKEGSLEGMGKLPLEYSPKPTLWGPCSGCVRLFLGENRRVKRATTELLERPPNGGSSANPHAPWPKPGLLAI